MANLIGKTIGPYQVVAQIYQTPTIQLYKVFDTRLGRYVALEIVEPSIPDQDTLFITLREHGKTLAQLNHPNIACILDDEMYDGLICLVYDFVPQGIFKKPFNRTYYWADSARILIPVAQALTYAHQMDVLHLALSPISIVQSTDGNLWLFDFGVEALIYQHCCEKLGGIWIGGGKSGYMAPEQVLGKDCSAQSDIYSLGMIYFEMIFGKRVYQEDTALREILDQYQQIAVNNLPEPVDKRLQAPIWMLLSQMINPDPQKRPKTMQAVSVLLTRIALGEKINRDMVKNPLKPRRVPIARKVLLKWLGTAAAGVLVVAIGVVLYLNPIFVKSITDPLQARLAPSPTPTAAAAAAAAATRVSLAQTVETAMPTPTQNFAAPTEPPAALVVPDLPIQASILGTPVPQSGKAIEASNANQIIPLSQWGLGPINRMGWMPDGKTVIYAAATGVYLVDIETKSILRYISTGAAVVSVDVSPDGQRLVTGEETGLIRLWNAADGTEIHAFSVHTQKVNAVRFSPDGKTLASASQDSTTVLWDINSGQILKTLGGHVGPIECLAFSPDGKTLATGGADFFAIFWDVQSGTQVGKINNGSVISDVTFSADGKWFADGGESGYIQIWNAATLEQLKSFRGASSPISSISFAPKGEMIAASDMGGHVNVLDFKGRSIWSGENNLFSREGQKRYTGISFSPDGASLASVNWDGNVHLWSTNDWKLTADFIISPEFVEKLDTSPHNLVAVQLSGGMVSVWDLQKGLPLYQVGGTLPDGKVFSPSGRYLAVLTQADTLTLFEADTGKQAFSFTHYNNMKTVRYKADEHLVAAGGNKELHLFSLDSGQEILTRLNFGLTGCSVVYDMNTVPLAFINVSHMIGFPGDNSQDLCQSKNTISWTKLFVYNQPNKVIAAGGPSMLEVWDGESANADTTSKKMSGLSGITLTSLAVSHSGLLVAGSTSDNLILVWDRGSGALLTQLYGHSDLVRALTFTQDDHYLISGSRDGTMAVWGVR